MLSDAFSGGSSKNLALVDRLVYESGMMRSILQDDRLNQRPLAQYAVQLTLFHRALTPELDPGFSEIHFSQTCCYSRKFSQCNPLARNTFGSKLEITV